MKASYDLLFYHRRPRFFTYLQTFIHRLEIAKRISLQSFISLWKRRQKPSIGCTFCKSPNIWITRWHPPCSMIVWQSNASSSPPSTRPKTAKAEMPKYKYKDRICQSKSGLFYALKLDSPGFHPVLLKSIHSESNGFLCVYDRLWPELSKMSVRDGHLVMWQKVSFSLQW